MKPSPLFIMAALALLNGLGPVAAQSPPEILRIDTSFLQLDSIVPFGYYVGDDAEDWEQLGQDVSDWKPMGRTALNLPAYTSRWLRTTLHNPYGVDVPLQLDASSIDIHRMSWIETSDGVEVSRKETGCAYPVAARPSKSASMSINFLLPRGATRTYYAHVQSAWTPIQTGIHVSNAPFVNIICKIANISNNIKSRGILAATYSLHFQENKQIYNVHLNSLNSFLLNFLPKWGIAVK